MAAEAVCLSISRTRHPSFAQLSYEVIRLTNPDVWGKARAMYLIEGETAAVLLLIIK